MHEKERPESWPIVTMMTIMWRRSGRSYAAAATEAASTGQMLSASPPDAGGSKARVMADRDDGEDPERRALTHDLMNSK